MAAHDDQISKNRRRLFKALSAAPVVVTLRPGSALAQNSAFQCLENIPEATQFIPGTEAILCEDLEDCSAYANLSYLTVPTAAPAAPSTLAADEMLVQTDPASGKFVKFSDGLDVDERVMETSPGSGVWDIYPADQSASTACYKGLTLQEGNFRVVAPKMTNPPGYDLSHGAVQPDFINPQHPDAVGITQSCLMSVDPDATITPHRFVKG